jgi:hypothetical protein
MSGLAGANDKERLDNLIVKTHKEQAVWFLNAFWEVPNLFFRSLRPSSSFCCSSLSFFALFVLRSVVSFFFVLFPPPRFNLRHETLIKVF